MPRISVKKKRNIINSVNAATNAAIMKAADDNGLTMMDVVKILAAHSTMRAVGVKETSALKVC